MSLTARTGKTTASRKAVIEVNKAENEEVKAPREYKPKVRSLMRRKGVIDAKKAPVEVARNFRFIQLMLEVSMDDIANVLNIAVGTVYKKLDGTAPLYMDEADILRSFFAEWRKEKIKALEGMKI